MKIYRYEEVPRSELLLRPVDSMGRSESVRSILQDVAARGDEALREYTRRFDRAEPDALETPREA